jgi:solute carrier family 34 (sodium-dependent phosphate cotransporter)
MKQYLKNTIFFIDSVFFIFVFIVGINGLSEALSLLFSSNLSGSVLHGFLSHLASPFFGLVVGIIATALMQSSSTTTAVTIAIVSSGALSIQTAIPIILGANFGTTITNTIVALLQTKKNVEKALAASTLHDFYNLMTLLIIFPLEMKFHLVEKTSFYLYKMFATTESLSTRFQNPLITSIDYINNFLKTATGNNPTIYLIISLAITVVALTSLVKILKSNFLETIKKSLSKKFFATPFRSWASGAVSTMIIQSSSVTTSLVIPLAAEDKLTLEQIYPYTVGANIGTGLTAFIAAVSLSPIAFIAALISLMFDVFSTFIIFLNPLLSHVPIFLARRFGYYSAKYKQFPFIYIVIAFIVLPLAMTRF